MSSPEFGAPTEHLQNQEAQQTLQAVGLAVQSLSKGRPRIDLPTEEIVTEFRQGTRVVELAGKHRVSTVTIYNRLHEVGSPKQMRKTETPVIEVSSTSNEILDRDAVRARIEEILNTQWDRKTKEGKKLYKAIIGELRRLSSQYPEIYKEVFRSGIDRIVNRTS